MKDTRLHFHDDIYPQGGNSKDAGTEDPLQPTSLTLLSISTRQVILMPNTSILPASTMPINSEH
jgi:hypothetical protein